MSILDERCMKRVTAGATVGAAVGGAVGVTCPACLAPCSSAHARRRLRRGCVRHIRGVSIPGACRRPRSAASTLGSGAPSLTGALSRAASRGCLLTGAGPAESATHWQDHHQQRSNLWALPRCRQPAAMRQEAPMRRAQRRAERRIRLGLAAVAAAAAVVLATATARGE
jgi:hypothetical protein